MKFLDENGLTYLWQKITNLQQETYNSMFPIGRGFIDFTDADYSNWLGFTWERELVGMFPVGYKSGDTDFGTIGKTGGAKTHTLTEAQLPKLSGRISMHSGESATNIASVSGKFSGTTVSQYKPAGNPVAGATSVGTINWNIGSGQAHNNLPPYQVVAYWKRIA